MGSPCFNQFSSVTVHATSHLGESVLNRKVSEMLLSSVRALSTATVTAFVPVLRAGNWVSISLYVEAVSCQSVEQILVMMLHNQNQMTSVTDRSR
jgi:hypothetical protein